MMRKTAAALFVAAVVGAVPAAARAGTCVSGGCHKAIVAMKFLHGPVAAEEAGAEGCVSCHQSAGAACSPQKGGVFKLKAEKDRLCLLCHERGTGTQHTRTRAQCLSCHSPHGSEESATLPLKKAGR